MLFSFIMFAKNSYFGNASYYTERIPKSLKEIMDNGFVDNPLRLRVAY